MAIHYAEKIGFPYCDEPRADGITVALENVNASKQFGGSARTNKRVSQSTTTTTKRANVDCADCITKMDANGIP